MSTQRVVKFKNNKGVYFGQVNTSRQPEGKGMFRFYDGTTYSGSWEEGLNHGYGMLSHPQRGYYKGNFSKGAFSGAGERHCLIQKRKFVGVWKEGFLEGTAQVFYENGTDLFEVNFSKGKPNGKGYFFKNQYLLIGNWANGLKQGKFLLVDSKNKAAYYLVYNSDIKIHVSFVNLHTLNLELILPQSEQKIRDFLPFYKYLKETENQEVSLSNSKLFETYSERLVPLPNPEIENIYSSKSQFPAKSNSTKSIQFCSRTFQDKFQRFDLKDSVKQRFFFPPQKLKVQNQSKKSASETPKFKTLQNPKSKLTVEKSKAKVVKSGKNTSHLKDLYASALNQSKISRSTERYVRLRSNLLREVSKTKK